MKFTKKDFYNLVWVAGMTLGTIYAGTFGEVWGGICCILYVFNLGRVLFIKNIPASVENMIDTFTFNYLNNVFEWSSKYKKYARKKRK